MREIKFRAWVKDDRVMFNVRSIDWDCNEAYVGLRTESLENLEVMQFTGLKDKNGVDIYEGDIVADRSDSDEVVTVEWSHDWCGYKMPDTFDEEYSYPLSQVTLEIIGNVYENPELLSASAKEI